MINYELAKQLKYAGFPQVTKDGGWIPGNVEYDDFGISTTNSIYIPTLSELIEACGDIILFKLPKGNEWKSDSNGLWVASQSSTYTDSCYLCADDSFIDTSLNNSTTGLNPAEAVVKLWLELNKK